jgi:hypothetical protein
MVVQDMGKQRMDPRHRRIDTDFEAVSLGHTGSGQNGRHSHGIRNDFRTMEPFQVISYEFQEPQLNLLFALHGKITT